MSGDNGELKELTELEKKQQAFADRPDEFVDMNELIFAVKKVNNNFETYIGSVSRTDLEIALIRITHQCFGVFNAMSHAQQQASKPKIITKPGGILNFVRNRVK